MLAVHWRVLALKGLFRTKFIIIIIIIIVIIIEMGRACSQNGGKYECFQNLSGKPTGKRTLGRPRRRWEDHIIMDLQEIGINGG